MYKSLSKVGTVSGGVASRGSKGFSGSKVCATIASAALLLTLGTQAQAQRSALFGHWDPIMHEDIEERIPGPWAGDYAGLSVNEAAVERADAWQPSLLTVPEHQCKPHPSTYGFRGVGNLYIWQEFDPKSLELVKIGTHIRWQAQRREIWMDDRPRPEDIAPHTWQGFSKAHWEGDTLVVYTTDLKAGWVRRNGLPLSDEATLTERFIPHGDLITHIMMVEDPVYLSEPIVKTNGWSRRAAADMEPYPCRPAVEIPREPGDIPHNLPGEADYSEIFAHSHGVPVESVRGGIETAMPEYQQTIVEYQFANDMEVYRATAIVGEE